MFNQRFFFFFLALVFFSVNNPVYSQSGVATFTLNNSARTSAGVYKADGTLVRTLWSGVLKDAGTYEIKWDGTDDFQQPLPAANYNIKIVSNNVQYIWEGTIGNSSTNQIGPTIHRSLDLANNIVIPGNNAYYTVGYNEGGSSHAQFALSNPQVKLDPFAYTTDQTTDYVCTDGTNVYWTAWDNYSDANSWVYATKVSDNSLVSFSAGVRYKATYGKDYPSVIDYKAIRAKPSGIAVSDNYLFVSYKSLGYVSVLDKTSGALVRTLTMTTPTAMAGDGNNIWITTGTNTLQKYPINSDGTLGASSLSIAGLSSPADVRVNGTMLAVVDAGSSQQIKTFNTGTGASIWTLGQPGGIANSPLVTNDRFAFWKIKEETGIKENRGGIAFAPDGSFWVVDAANRRMMHYDGNRNFIESVIYQGKTYTCYVDPNNHSRVMANLMEFQVDYSNSNIQNAWTHKYNWEGKFKEGYNLQDGVRDITTLSNGRTYGLIIVVASGAFEVVELDPATGLRFTGVLLYDAKKMYPDGSVYNIGGTAVNETQIWTKRTLTGFNGNNPVFSNPAPVLKSYLTDMKQPRLSGAKVLPWEVTSSNVLVCFRGNKENAEVPGSYHLGGLNPSTGQWIWKTSRSTFDNYAGQFPADGTFDIGNGPPQYLGNVAMAIDKSIIWGYNGEFWKNSQTNKWNHYYDNGLFIGQFGVTGPEYNAFPTQFPGMAGNSFAPAIIKENGDYYMYHNDESVHGGVHRWKITGLNTIQEQTIPITSSFIRSDETAVLPGIDLMAGLPYRATLASNTAGWTRTPDLEETRWSAKTNLLTYNERKSPDLYVTYNPSVIGVNTINRTLGTNINLTNWEITGKLTFNASEPNGLDGKGLTQYLNVLDNTGKIIVQFFQAINDATGTITVYANDIPILTKPIIEWKNMTKNFFPLSINKSGNSINVSYAGQTATVSSVHDAGADISTPSTMQLYFKNSGGALYEKFTGISDFKFNSFTETTIPSPPTLASDDITNTLIASNALGNTEIEVSENNGGFVPYVGKIDVGDVARAAGYWKFKIKSAAQRTSSAIIYSPEFTESYVPQCSATGTILHEVWNNVSGSSINSNNWSGKPDNTSPLTLFEAPQNIGDNFAARIRGYICPPQSGNYTFWIAGDDATELWLSSDADPGNKTRIAYTHVATAPRDWSAYSTQKSVEIYLKAGNKYYIEALHKEEYRDDNLAVGWRMPDGTMEAPIPGSRLSPFSANFDAAPVTTCSATGMILHEVWNNVTGSSVNSNNWSAKPDNTSPLASFEAPQNIGDNFAARIRGYVCPPQSGNYTFWIAGDDATELWLSSDADPGNKTRIAYTVLATASRDWTAYSSQKSFQIYLKAGNKYYIEALHKEEYRDDNFAVAWTLPDGTMEAPIAGSRLSPFNTNFDTVAIAKCSATGTILHEVWNNVRGSSINSNNWSGKPDNISPLTLFEAPQNIGDNFAARIRGYICPPQSGNYTFWIAGDDATELWLSSDADPGNKTRIAYTVLATASRDWNAYSSQKSFQIYLKAGNKYYIEALHKEEYRDDNFAVAWQLPDGTMEAPIAGSHLSPFDTNFDSAPVTACSATGTILHEVWNNVTGSSVNSNNWSAKPNSTSALTLFEAPQNIGDNFAARIRGYICPPQTGNYTFWVAGDDAAELWLSSDADPSNKTKIAYTILPTGSRNWGTYATQKSFQIYLRAGNKYYIEALHKEEYRDDNLAVAWQLPDGTMEAPILGSHLSPFNPDNSTTLNALVATGNAVNATESLGASSASEVIANQGMSQGLEWKIYPNPIIGNNISIQSGFIPKGDYNLLLVDGLGQTIFKKSVTHGGGPFNYSISLSSKLSKGSYVLNISGKGVRFTKKLLK